MIIGIGTDIVETARIRKLVEKYGEHFVDKILRPAEVAACNESANRIHRIAARFAAKESLAKAFGIGISETIHFQNIEISNGPHGEPHLTLYGTARELQSKLHITRIHLSMSHADKYATAVVILESEQPPSTSSQQTNSHP